MWKIWLVAAGVFLIIEILNMSFLIFWFSIGSLVAMVASFFIDSIVAQTTIFLVVSTLLLFATKPFVNKFLPKESFVKTNAFSIEGKVGKVVSDIDPVEGKGQVKVNGENWSAKSLDDSYIPQNTEVIVEKIDGVKVIVKPLVK